MLFISVVIFEYSMIMYVAISIKFGQTLLTFDPSLHQSTRKFHISLLFYAFRETLFWGNKIASIFLKSLFIALFFNFFVEMSSKFEKNLKCAPQVLICFVRGGGKVMWEVRQGGRYVRLGGRLEAPLP